jgi:hypothetical protein
LLSSLAIYSAEPIVVTPISSPAAAATTTTTGTDGAPEVTDSPTSSAQLPPSASKTTATPRDGTTPTTPTTAGMQGSSEICQIHYSLALLYHQLHDQSTSSTTPTTTGTSTPTKPSATPSLCDQALEHYAHALTHSRALFGSHPNVAQILCRYHSIFRLVLPSPALLILLVCCVVSQFHLINSVKVLCI